MSERMKKSVHGVRSHEVSNLWLGSNIASLKRKIPILTRADVGRGLRDDKATRRRRPICTVQRLEMRNQAFPYS
jgi:hypothetical protein